MLSFALYFYVMLNDDKLWQAQKELKTMMEGFSEIMTLEEAAKYLKIGKSTLYKMARQNPRRENC